MTFQAWSDQHLIPLALTAMLSVAILLWARRLDERQRVLPGRLIALAILAYILIAYYQRWKDAGLEAVTEALPLHLCDLVVLICLWAVLSPSQGSFELAYYWGLAGALQALLQPDISQGLGFPSWYYMEYFLGHGMIFAAVLYLMAAYRLRPHPGSVLRAMLALNLYALVVGALDFAFGWNYGYLCSKPASSSLMDYLGPWPFYLLGLEVLSAINFLLLWLPWRVREGGRLENANLILTGPSARTPLENEG
ncbi:TIGR02206 family membrane protein [bacterium CPR1]|nr:TIGR02206 family membrane protein [bacterium CPR1]